MLRDAGQSKAALCDKYQILRQHGLWADWYAKAQRGGRKFKLPALFLRLVFERMARVYKKGTIFESNLERYYCESAYGFSVGRHSYGFMQFCADGVNLASIGSFCSFAPGITITGSNHPLHHITTHPFIYYANIGRFIERDDFSLLDQNKNQKITIGHDVWIGQNATILPSVSIGNGAVVGAGSIVSKNIPDYAVVAGNPARIIKYRFSEQIIHKLNHLKWWEWPDELIAERVALFSNPGEFLDRFERQN